MTSKEQVLDTMRAQGKAMAQAVQDSADNLTSTELVEKREYLPEFSEAVKVKNMLDRPVGFTVKTALSNVCRLLNVYDSTIYTDEPESYPSMWGGVAKRSLVDNNVNSPGDYPQGWEDAE